MRNNGNHTTSIEIPIELYEKAKGRVVFKEALMLGIQSMLGDLPDKDQAMHWDKDRTHLKEKINELQDQIQDIEQEAMNCFGMSLDEFLEQHKPTDIYQSNLEDFIVNYWEPYKRRNSTYYDFNDPHDVADCYTNKIKNRYGITNISQQIEFCKDAYKLYMQNKDEYQNRGEMNGTTNPQNRL